MEEQRLDALRVVQAAVDAGPERRADHQRAAVGAVRAVADLGRLVDDLVVGRVDVVGELDLGDRAEAVHRRADGHPGDAQLGQRRVDDPVGAELLLEAVGGAEDAAVHADVLAEHDHARVALHLFVERLVDGLDQRLERHDDCAVDPGWCPRHR